MDEYCLVGRDVSRSPSPAMMNAAFAELGIDARYAAVSIPEARFPEEFARLKGRGPKGINVTIPYKTSVIPMLDGLDAVALRVRAVNTVGRDDGRYLGHNTDPDGIVGPLKRHLPDFDITSALLVGAGGAARGFCEAMNRLGCRDIVAAVREPPRGAEFVSEMEKAFPRLNLSLASLGDLRHVGHELIFNASPIGSRGIPLPPEVRRIVPGSRVVFDAVYTPKETELLALAGREGCVVVYGHEMLLHQGMAAFKIWTGREAPEGAMGTALGDALAGAAS
jgi:shikimate dehydrogenase